MNDKGNCPICIEEITTPVILNCKHIYCTTCIQTYEKKGGKLCPCCRTPFFTEYTMSKEDQLLLLKLKFNRFDERCGYSYDISYKYDAYDSKKKRVITLRVSDGSEHSSEVAI